MRIWLSKNSEVPIREQLTEQLMLGIVSRDLEVGRRLPSIRELARRFDIHPNTVNAAYRELSARGWVEFRKGSGVYVRARVTEDAPIPQLELDHMIAEFLRRTREKGFPLGEIQARIARAFAASPPDRILVLESDHALRDILVSEIAEATGCRVVGKSPDECADAGVFAGVVASALNSRAESLKSLLPPKTECVWLTMRSIPQTMTGQQRPAPDEMVALASHWPEFLRWGRMLLVAAGIDGDALNVVDAREDDWRARVLPSAFVVCDSLTNKSLPDGCRSRVFSIVADESLAELRLRFEEFHAVGR
jgi:GntR family transcriptional regulator